jgi:uncharacterized membrane protein
MNEPIAPPPPSPATPGFDGGAGAVPPRQGPSAVPAGHGSAWWSEGWRLFAAKPWVWIAITILFVVITVMLHFIPMLGSLASTLLAPVFAGGILTGCRALDHGHELTINPLFASFSDRLVPLIIVGVAYLVATLVIMVIVFGGIAATIGVTGIGALMSGDPLEAGFALLAGLGVGTMLAVLIGLLLLIPLLMAYWFAPALVVFRNEDPLAAMKLSFDANIVNMLPMTVYGLLGIVFAIVASIPLGLGWCVLFPVFATSVYASYKDIFGDPG